MVDRAPGPVALPRGARAAKGGRRTATCLILLVQGRDHLRGARPRLLRQQERRHRRLRGADAESSITCRGWASTRSGCCRSIRRRCATMGTTSRTTRTSIRATARSADFERLRRGGAPARHPRHHRAGHQSHLGPAPLVPGRAARAGGIARARLLRLERHQAEVPRASGSSSPTPRPPTGGGTTPRRPTTGTASSITSPT